MAKDLIYVFDKKTYKSTALGEIQASFNMSFVIDGTKDSAKVTVISFDGNEVEPNTIVYHKKTSSWWIVASDKVERYLNYVDESNDKTPHFVYTHDLQLEGAIELLNARDLTDCGFNDNTYTIREFILRLFGLSTFEYSVQFASGVSANFLNKKVDFIKTFENYTLLSAIREFLDAYNMCPKLLFDTQHNALTDVYTIRYAQLNIISKTGDFSLTSHNIDDFDDIRETKVLNKDSFGTCVVSNAENVISSKEKIYPSTGFIRISGTEDNITPTNAVLRLPSKVYKGNWIKIQPDRRGFDIDGEIGSFSLVNQPPQNALIGADGVDNIWYYLIEFVKNIDEIEGLNGSFFNPFLQALRDSTTLVDDTIKSSTFTLYDGNKLVPTGFGSDGSQAGKIVIQKGDNVPYLAKISIHAEKKECIFCDKEIRDLLPLKRQGIYWERGSNLIKGFEMWESVNSGISTDDYMQTDLQRENDENDPIILFAFSNQYGNIRIKLPTIFAVQFKRARFIINYIPMTDLKIKVDNQRDKRDMQLYNQNGKITDNVALSKLINSYSKEISSDKITRYMQYTRYTDVPKIASVVNVGNEYYVINNISLDFSQNETNTTGFGYYIEAEITMCKYISTKSLMVNPNTNIRDYGIPQNYNVKRKQLYRDYYELAYETYSDANNDTPYYDTDKMFTMPISTNFVSDLSAIMQIKYDEPIGSEGEESNVWWYQLDTVVYYLDKMFYIMLDFNDNNIIGYGSQNVFSGFDISRVISGLNDLLNTPISYVDNNGRFKAIDILLCNNEQMTTIYNEYQNDNGGNNWNGSIYDYSVFIPEEIYLPSLNDNRHEIRITCDEEIDDNTQDYNKDALEVPVFEYSCQLDDSNDVLIGDNFFTQHANCFYFYSFVVGDNLTQNNVLPTSHIEQVVSPASYTIQNSCEFSIQDIDSRHKSLLVSLVESQTLNLSNFTWDYGNDVSATPNKDIAIFRHALNVSTGEIIEELMFIAKKVPSDHITTSTIKLDINYYKLN